MKANNLGILARAQHGQLINSNKMVVTLVPQRYIWRALGALAWTSQASTREAAWPIMVLVRPLKAGLMCFAESTIGFCNINQNGRSPAKEISWKHRPTTTHIMFEQKYKMISGFISMRVPLPLFRTLCHENWISYICCFISYIQKIKDISRCTIGASIIKFIWTSCYVTNIIMRVHRYMRATLHMNNDDAWNHNYRLHAIEHTAKKGYEFFSLMMIGHTHCI